MSFSSKIKEKLAGAENPCPSCDIYELAGFLGNAGKINKEGIVLITENKKAAEAICSLINKRYSGNFMPCFNSNLYKTEIKDEAISSQILKDTRYLEKDLDIENECCMAAFAKGAFLGGGSINDPQKSYHMEFDYKYSEQAEKLKCILEKTGVSVKATERKGHTVLYVKEYEMIAGVLGLIGAGGAAIEIYNISAEKEIRNEINRQMNCENANMDKIASAYCKHMQAIEKIKSGIGFDKLPDTLREAAILRMKFPEDSLKDLGAKFSPPIGKSGVNHRLNRLIEMAENL